MERNKASFRDPSGFVFTEGGVLFRQINSGYRAEYEKLVSSGLYEELVSERLLLAHEEADHAGAAPDCFKVIRPERIEFISYPYEWCFSQLKDAALAMLKIQKLALDRGMILKDASVYNIQFHGGAPVLIDTLSFEIYQEGQPWHGYRQFCRHFLAPLALMAKTDTRLNCLCREYIDGVPLDLAAALLPVSTLLDFALLSHIHLHARAEKRCAKTSETEPAPAPSMSPFALNALVDNLQSGVYRLRLPQRKTEWGDYYANTNYTPAAFEAKKRVVGEMLDMAAPRRVWDLGANNGEFSRIACAKGVRTVAFDADANAVEQNYLAVKKEGLTELLPLAADLTCPSPAIGWANDERDSLTARADADCVMALALIHHLAISNNIPLERIAGYFSRLAEHLIIEFVPKDDSKVKILLASRKDIFDGYSRAGFETAFGQYYEIIKSELLPESGRIIYLMRRRNTYPND